MHTNAYPMDSETHTHTFWWQYTIDGILLWNRLAPTDWIRNQVTAPWALSSAASTAPWRSRLSSATSLQPPTRKASESAYAGGKQRHTKLRADESPRPEPASPRGPNTGGRRPCQSREKRPRRAGDCPPADWPPA